MNEKNLNGGEHAALEDVLTKTIARLRIEITRIEQAIQKLMQIKPQTLENLDGSRRGRKHMSLEERAVVSERMRRYWERRRRDKSS